MKTDTLSLYVHIPFCNRKCDYCDFVSFVKSDDEKERYVSALISQISKKQAEFAGNMPVDSVFFGGGTPSVLRAEQLTRILEEIRKRFLLTQDAEITIEVNPNSATFEKLKTYHDAGIGRMSIGLQSFSDEELKKLSRLHTAKDFLETFDNARNAGFHNLNVDLMSAIPGQTVASFEDSLSKVISLQPEHISAYSLIVEEGTPFYERYANGKHLPSEEEERRIYHRTREILSQNGYHPYEISNFAKPGYECRHNIGYWTLKPYLGFGVAAASFINNTRYKMHTDFSKYLNYDFTEETEPESERDLMEEFMFLGLRMDAGVSKAEFKNRFHKDIRSVYADALDKLLNEKLITEDERIKLTDLGRDLANYCELQFMQ